MLRSWKLQDSVHQTRGVIHVETGNDQSRFSSNWNTCQEWVVASLSGACLLAARSEVF